MKNKTFRILLVVLSLLTVLSFASCAAAKDSVGNLYAPEAAPEAPSIGMTNDKLFEDIKALEAEETILMKELFGNA